jgi:hypothetical protein
MRVRETAGVSWWSEPGVRRWRSRSITVSGRSWLAWYLIVLPFFLFPLWASAEMLILSCTGLACLIAMACYRAPPGALHIARNGWFWYFDLDLPGR